MVREAKERGSFVNDVNDKAMVTWPNKDGKPTQFDITKELKEACRAIVPDIVAGLRKLVSSYDAEFQKRMLTNVMGPGPAAVATSLVPDMDHFRGSFGARAVIPLWCNASGTQPNVADGLLDRLSEGLGLRISAEMLLAYCYAVLGTRGYVADLMNGMLILDTSKIQARTPGAQPRVIAAFATPQEIEQSTVPLTYGAHRYVLLFTEGRVPPKACTPGQPNFGYPRLVDVADEHHPVEASRMQTEAVLPANCAKVATDFTVQTRGLSGGDPFSLGLSGVFGYDSHYCTPDRLHDPVAARLEHQALDAQRDGTLSAHGHPLRRCAPVPPRGSERLGSGPAALIDAPCGPAALIGTPPR